MEAHKRQEGQEKNKFRYDAAGQNMEDERARLERTYAEISDEALKDLAADEASLTAIARQVLEAELASRGIEKQSPPLVEPRKHSGPLVMIKRFRDLPEAFVARSILDSAQIESFLADENLVRLDWLYSNLIGGAKLMVRPEDAAEAMALLDESANEENAAKGMGAADETDVAGEANE